VAELGGRARRELRAFAELNYSSPLDPGDEAPTFTRRSRGFLRSYQRGGEWPAPRSALADELSLVRRAARALRGVRSLRPFAHEARPFLGSAARGARAAAAAATLLAGERPTLAVHRVDGGLAGRAAPPDPGAAGRLRAGLARAERAVRTDSHNTFGYRGRVLDIPKSTIPANRLDAFLARVHRLDGAWAPTAAAASVRVTLDGRRLRLASDGSFRLPPSATGLLVARDGAGGRTAARVAR
jgi:hypothetical protein